MIVKQPSFIKLVGQKGLVILTNLEVGHLTDQLALCRIASYSLKNAHITEKLIE